jgi:ABC-type transport system involved in multi-copper enzyme maturation permease subunit
MEVSERIINIKRNRFGWMGAIIGICAILVFGSNAVAGSPSTEQTLPPQSSDFRVLWDLSHSGGLKYYTPTNLYQPLVQNLASQGFIVDATNRGFLVENLTRYHVLVVCLGSAWMSSYGSAEVARIKDFVNSGGGLLIMGDNPVCRNVNIQPIASSFGVSLGLSIIDP